MNLDTHLQPRRHRAFTLVEMLVVIAIMSILVTTGAIGLSNMGGKGAKVFRILGTEILTDYTGPDQDLVPSGRVVAAVISATVLSDFAMDQIQDGNRTFSSDKTKAEFLAKNSYNFTKMVQLPGL